MMYKSGVVHEPMAVSDKETALAAMDTIKTNSGLFNEQGGSYVAPRHNYKIVKNGLSKAITGIDKLITAYKADINGIPHVHYMERCTGCDECKEHFKQRLASKRL